MEFKRICAHEHAGVSYVLGELPDSSTNGEVVLWQKLTAETSMEHTIRLAKSFAHRYNCEYGCMLPYTLNQQYQVGGSEVN